MESFKIKTNCGICQNKSKRTKSTEQRKRCDALTARFDKATALDIPVERFEPSLRCALPDFVTVYSKEDVRFTLKNGAEIKV